MRPFKFFFTVSLGIILFLFLAKFILFAIVAAAIFSILYHGLRKLQWFFHRRMDWEYDRVDDRYYEHIPSAGRRSFFDREERYPDYLSNYRTIVIQ